MMKSKRGEKNKNNSKFLKYEEKPFDSQRHFRVERLQKSADDEQKVD